MTLKPLIAATLIALSSMALAQTSGPTSSDAATTTTSGSSVGGVDVTRCSDLMGAEREKCMLEQRGGASAGATSASPGIATTTPAPLATPSSPTNPTALPGSSTTPSGK